MRKLFSLTTSWWKLTGHSIRTSVTVADAPFECCWRMYFPATHEF
jgi:hypothetical protein